MSIRSLVAGWTQTESQLMIPTMSVHLPLANESAQFRMDGRSKEMKWNEFNIPPGQLLSDEWIVNVNATVTNSALGYRYLSVMQMKL